MVHHIIGANRGAASFAKAHERHSIPGRVDVHVEFHHRIGVSGSVKVIIRIKIGHQGQLERRSIVANIRRVGRGALDEFRHLWSTRRPHVQNQRRDGGGNTVKFSVRVRLGLELFRERIFVLDAVAERSHVERCRAVTVQCGPCGAVIKLARNNFQTSEGKPRLDLDQIRKEVGLACNRTQLRRCGRCNYVALE